MNLLNVYLYLMILPIYILKKNHCLYLFNNKIMFDVIAGATMKI